MQLNIPPEKRQRIIDAMKGLFPIPLILDPDWPGHPSNAPWVPEYTDAAWAKEVIIQYIKKNVRRWEVSQATRIASDSISIDDDLVS